MEVTVISFTLQALQPEVRPTGTQLKEIRCGTELADKASGA